MIDIPIHPPFIGPMEDEVDTGHDTDSSVPGSEGRCPKCGSEFACLCHPLRRAERRELIRQTLLRDPTPSDRTIGGQLGVDHKTVGSVRQELIANGEIPQCPTTGKDGRTWQRPAVAPPDDVRPRAKHDFYATPAVAVLPLLEREAFEGRTWEPCCGMGHIARVWPGEIFATDLIYRGYGEGGINFLTTWKDGIENVVTNPPLAEEIDGELVTNLALRIAYRALHVAKKKVALLMPLDLLTGVLNYQRLFYGEPFLKRFKACYVFVRHPRFLKNGTEPYGSPQHYAWFVWERGFEGRTILEHLR